ncbi:MAG: Asp-tRNA(Asn)/Glu-tRNA(Gln) amidotransferase GatCAB subunit A [Porticoccaceae bacterium]|nr:Asp-tRNA(Asn)/Glu-tRNA(Gln) amidotransferase GatCAB subunit A [Porticoccaceae bacterium]|tara:strand:+ start:560 stop:2014 length:1455 start_codon:yes stop_codon:yes gene_type:complete
MHDMSIASQILGLKKREFSSLELTRHYLGRIERLNPILNALITVTEEQALESAKRADEMLSGNIDNELCGIPLVHKDIFCTRGVKTSCGSKMLHNFVPPYDATVVENLAQAGTVMLGKANMDEFAMGSSNETSFYGPVKNPWDITRVPGGSSGGSAAAVAARMTPAATATDTGGSIRQPAALCGVTGLKPTYGLVSRWGMIAFASSLDQGGPIARTAEDCAILLNTMASYDHRDSTSLKFQEKDYRDEINRSISGCRIGIPREYFSNSLSPSVEATVFKALRVLTDLGAILVDISLPNTKLSVPAYYVIAPAEASANLARFDGIRFGHRCENPQSLEDLYCRTRAEGFGEEVQRRILIGTYCLSAGYHDAYYKKAQQVRHLIKQDFTEAFSKVDVVASPTCPAPAFKFGEKSDDPVKMYLEDIYTIATNLAGLPGMSIPCGFVDRNPIGLQLIGNYLQEARILNIAHCIQKETDWHNSAPKEPS